MAEIAQKTGNEKIVYSGQIIEVIEYDVKIGNKRKVFEKARHSPGTRLIITKGDQVLLTKEHRIETDRYDYRLPGGKVFDTLVDFRTFLGDGGDVERVAKKGAMTECQEETGLKPRELKHFATVNAGSTVEWDLYYYIISDFEELATQDLGDGEDISLRWMTRKEIEKIIKENAMDEYRSIGVLYQYFLSHK